MGLPDQPFFFVALLLLAAEFPWWESKAATRQSSGGSFIKVGALIFFACYFLCLPPPNRGGILEFDGRLASVVLRRKIRFGGSWRCEVRHAKLSTSRCHGGSRGMMAMLLRFLFDVLGEQ